MPDDDMAPLSNEENVDPAIDDDDLPF